MKGGIRRQEGQGDKQQASDPQPWLLPCLESAAFKD